MLTLIDSMLIPMEYVARDPMTATEIRFKLGEFERSPAMEELNQHFQDWIDQVTEKLLTTPIQFRFPRSKRKRIRKKWRKDSRNFRRLLDDQFEDIQIVGSAESFRFIDGGDRTVGLALHREMKKNHPSLILMGLAAIS